MNLAVTSEFGKICCCCCHADIAVSKLRKSTRTESSLLIKASHFNKNINFHI